MTNPNNDELIIELTEIPQEILDYERQRIIDEELQIAAAFKAMADAEDDANAVPRGTMMEVYAKCDPAIQKIKKDRGYLALHFDLTPQSTPENLEETIDYLDERRKVYDEIPEVVKLKFQIEKLKEKLLKVAEIQKTDNEFWKRVSRMKEVKPYYDLWKKLNAIDTDFLDVIYLDATIDFYEKLKLEGEAV